MNRYLMALTVLLMGSLGGQGAIALELTGALTQGSLLMGRVPPGTEVALMKRQISVGEDGLFVFGLGRNTPSEIELTTRHGDGEVETHLLAIDQREYQEQRVDGVPQKTVSPPSPEVLERILREATLVKKARAEDNRSQDFLSGFVRPLEGPITGVYGSRRVYNGKPGRPHYGLDIAAPKGSDVFAPAPGVVRLVHDDMFYSGGTLILEHGHGISSTFIHLSEVLAVSGQRVDAGDLIARVGSTGRATGPHLDWRINWFDVRLDPALVLEHFPVQASPGSLTKTHN